MTIRDLKLTDITVDDAILLRPLDEKLAKDYAEAMRHRDPFPPVDVFYDGDVYRLADGRHRVHAAHLAKRDTITADVQEGGFLEALKFAAGANETHGQRRKPAVKRAYVRHLLLRDELVECTNREIARMARVSHNTVVTIRRKLESGGIIEPRKKAKVKRGSQTYLVNCPGNGKTKKTKKKRGPRLSSNDRRARDICLEFIEDNQTSPYDGGEAVRRWAAYEWRDKFKRTRQWLTEAIAECERAVKEG